MSRTRFLIGCNFWLWVVVVILVPPHLTAVQILPAKALHEPHEKQTHPKPIHQRQAYGQQPQEHGTHAQRTHEQQTHEQQTHEQQTHEQQTHEQQTHEQQTHEQQTHGKHQSALLDTLIAKMEPRVRPNPDGPPVEVECDMFILSFGSISEFDMDYTIDIYLRQKWQDPRLAYTGTPQPIILNRKLMGKVWNPDLYFPFEKRASYHNIPVPNKRMRVFPNGTVQYSYRVTLTVSCPMELSKFPVDRQACKLIVESFTYEDTDVKLKWSSVPIGMPRGIELPRFNLTYFKSKTCREKNYKTGEYSCLKVTFHLKRQFGYYLLQTYVPTAMVVMLSWVEFWINKDSEPARVGMGVGTVLTMATQLASTKNSMPRISYPKAIDVWLTVCMFFVYAAMVEYAFVNTFSRMEKRAKVRKEEEEYLLQHAHSGAQRYGSDRGGARGARGSNSTKEGHLADRMADRMSRWTKLDKQHKRIEGGFPVAQSIDDFSRFVFPIAFLLFNILYWMYYLRY